MMVVTYDTLATHIGLPSALFELLNNLVEYLRNWRLQLSVDKTVTPPTISITDELNGN